MKLFNFNFSKEKEKEKKITKKGSGPSDISSFKADVPTISEKNDRGGWVDYTDPTYTTRIMSFLDFSALHNRIIQSKANLVSGKEFLIDGVDMNEWIKTADIEQSVILKSFISNSFNNDWYKIKKYISLDFEISGEFALEVIWSRDFSRIQSVNYIPWTRIRPGIMNEDGIIDHIWYCDNWDERRSEKIKAQSFTLNAHQPKGLTEAEIVDYEYEHSQILYVKNHWPGLDYFGRPTYFGGLMDILTSTIVSEYNVSSIQTGFSPSIAVLVNKPESMEEEMSIGRNFMKQFSGVGRKVLLYFFNGDENKPEFQPIDVKNISDQYNAVRETSKEDILTAHGITAPEMFGIQTPGKLGAGELDIAWSVFYNDIILDFKSVVEGVFNELISINNFNSKVTFETKKPFEAK